MKMILGDECELEYRLGLIREQDQEEPSSRPILENPSSEKMPTAHYMADQLRAGLIAGGVEANQIADSSDIVNWFLVYEAPQGSWHRAYAQCLATLTIYFFEPAGSLTSPAERLARAADLRRLEEECGHVLMADRLRMATEEVTQQLEKTWLWFERTSDALIDVSAELRSVKRAGTGNRSDAITEKLSEISATLQAIQPTIEKTAAGVAALQPKETLAQEAARERNKRVAAAILDGTMTKAQAFAEGYKADNLKRILGAERKRRKSKPDESVTGQTTSSPASVAWSVLVNGNQKQSPAAKTLAKAYPAKSQSTALR